MNMPQGKYKNELYSKVPLRYLSRNVEWFLITWRMRTTWNAAHLEITVIPSKITRNYMDKDVEVDESFKIEKLNLINKLKPLL